MVNKSDNKAKESKITANNDQNGPKLEPNFKFLGFPDQEFNYKRSGGSAGSGSTSKSPVFVFGSKTVTKTHRLGSGFKSSEDSLGGKGSKLQKVKSDPFD